MPNTDSALTFGVNWLSNAMGRRSWPTRIRQSFEDVDARADRRDQPTIWSGLLRLQIVF